MRNFVILIALTCSISLYAQWNEDFNDGDLSQNPTWSGNRDLFTINSSLQLQLNASSAGNAYLSTNHPFYKGNIWSCWLKLGFTPSSASFARIYLSADNENLTTAQSAYYILAGGTSKRISLFKKSISGTNEVIVGPDNELSSGVSADIKVELSHDHIWRLFVKYSTNVDYVLKGEYKDPSLLNGNYLGLNCAYATSYSKSIYFDNFRVDSIPEFDTTPPQVSNLNVINSHTINLQFSESCDFSIAQFSINQENNSITKTISTDEKSIELSSSIPFTEGNQYIVTITGVKDKAGNEALTATLPFTYWSILGNAKIGDVVISEIMANPSSSSGLPDAEYVEIHNNSSSRVNLSQWKFYYGDKEYSIPDYWLLPDSFVVIANPTAIAKMATNIPKLAVTSFPVLANSGKLLYLESPEGELISFANYTDQWYNDDFKAGGGFSLECIDLNNISGGKTNWSATKNSLGGTPGKQNSITASNPDYQIPTLLQSSLISSDTIRLTFSEVMNKLDLVDLAHYATSSDFQIKNAIALNPLPTSVTLILNKSIEQGDILKIELTNLHSISGILIENIDPIRLAISEQAAPQDVVINEILFNPRPNGGDYVEILNRSQNIIDLSKLYLSSKKSDGSFQTGVKLADTSTPFFPNEILVFTTDKSNIINEYPTSIDKNVVQLSSLPSMPDTEGNIQLINSSAEVIDGLSYSEKMHHPFVKNPEGVSLERLNSEQPTSDSNNWQSASSEAGWGTPGRENSQQSKESNESKEFWLENETVTPDNNGQDDQLRIHYSLSESGYTANIRVYSPSGKLISAIVSNSILSSEGLIAWSATDTTGRLLNPGLYLLFIEYYRFNKSPTRIKLPIVIGN
ncbi:MAG: lamin tail domain-containing protein [Bacteroidales bacterium]|nr:lamin tail domain-containing protein [Bacteroidales bacterium]